MHAPLLERDAELRAVEETLGAARAGDGGIVFVEAATGVGKSRLLKEAELLAGDSGMAVLCAHCRDLERDLPFGVARQLFERELADASEERRDALLSGSASLAAPLLLRGEPTPEGAAASLHGLYWLAANIGESQPLVLTVDDLHRCDRPTLRFLVYLAQRIEELPIALVVAATEGRGSGMDTLLGELRSHPATMLVRPQPLSEGAVGEALRELGFADAESSFVRACHEATGGNPLLLSELAVELGLRRIEPRARNAELVHRLAPEPIAAAVLVRLRRLGRGAPELAQAIAVLGDGVELRHAAALAGMSLEQAGRLADSLMGAGLLEGTQKLSFVHPVVRLAVYAERPEFDRAEAHRHAAALLLAEGAPMKQVIPHLLEGRPNADPRAVDVLIRAGQAALAGGAPRSAIRLLRRALDEPPDPDRRPEVLAMLGRAEGAAGAPEAIGHLTGAMELLGDPASRASAALDTGRVLISHGRWEDAVSTLQHGIDDIGDTDPTLRTQLEVTRAAACQAAGIADPAETPFDADDPTLEDRPDGRLLLARAAARLAVAGTSAAKVRELATRAMARGALLAQERADGVGFHMAVFALVLAEDLQTAELAASMAIDDARQRGSVLGYASSSHLRSLAMVARGRLSEATADAIGALEARSYGWCVSLASAAAVPAEAHLERGDLAHARRALAAHEPRPGSALPVDYRFYGVRGRLRLLEDSPEEGLEDLRLSASLQRQLGGENPALYPWRTYASAALLSGGDAAEARRLAEEEVGLAEAFGAPGAHGRALGALASIAAGKEALELRAEAVRVLDSSQLALERARALIEYGAALRRAGRRKQASGPLREGLDLAGRCGARVLVQRAKDELAVLGARPRREAASGTEALTAREAQVAGLAAQGMQNREIAESLFITVKTVEWHLRHTYEKLGVRSRRDLTRALAGRADSDA